MFPDSPIHFFCFLYILCCLLYRNPHLGTPQHHYLAVTPSGRSGSLNSYRVPLLLMPVSVQSQVSGMLNGRLRFHSLPSPAPLETTTPFRATKRTNLCCHWDRNPRNLPQIHHYKQKLCAKVHCRYMELLQKLSPDLLFDKATVFMWFTCPCNKRGIYCEVPEVH